MALAIAAAEGWTKRQFSLGLLYLFPGRKLNALELYKKRTNAGMSLILSRENSHRVHDLARRYDVTPAPDVAAQCADCVPSQADDTRQV